jgi:hypothetical protein
MRTERFTDRHPLCSCPALTWDMATGRTTAPDLNACRARSPFADPHPVLDADAIREIVDNVMWSGSNA